MKISPHEHKKRNIACALGPTTCFFTPTPNQKQTDPIKAYLSNLIDYKIRPPQDQIRPRGLATARVSREFKLLMRVRLDIRISLLSGSPKS